MGVGVGVRVGVGVGVCIDVGVGVIPLSVVTVIGAEVVVFPDVSLATAVIVY